MPSHEEVNEVLGVASRWELGILDQVHRLSLGHLIVSTGTRGNYHHTTRKYNINDGMDACERMSNASVNCIIRHLRHLTLPQSWEFDPSMLDTLIQTRLEP